MLKMTGVGLELISDIDMHLFIEKGVRGGILYIAKRYSKANNKYMKDYYKRDWSKYIMYFDANNLYGWAMTQCLPYGDFEWMTEEEFVGFNFNSVSKNNLEGYILEVDLKYPDELHYLHNDYLLAPEKLKVNSDILSKYCREIDDKYEIKLGKVNKLIPNLGDKTSYVLHYRNLQLYVSLGMKVERINRVLKFKQLGWLKKFVDFNKEKRKNANNTFEKDFFKLMVNIVFGKQWKI